MRIECSGPAKRKVAPDLAQQLLLGEDTSGLGGELGEQVVLLSRQGQRAAVDGRATGDQVDGDRAGLEPVAQRGRGPAQHGPDPREQLVVVERTRDVIVAAAVEGTNAVDRVRFGAAEYDHGHFAIPGATRLTLAQPAAELRRRKDE